VLDQLRRGGNKFSTPKKRDNGIKKKMRYIAAIYGFILGIWCLQATAGDGWSTLKNDPQGYEVPHPYDWEVSLDKDTNVIGIYTLSLLSFDAFKSDVMEMRVYTLGNPEKKPVEGFLTSGKMKSKEYIKRTEASINGMDAVWVGYEYTPPQYGIIKYEVEMMIALSPAKMAYVQICATKSVSDSELKSIVEKVIEGFKKTS